MAQAEAKDGADEQLSALGETPAGGEDRRSRPGADGSAAGTAEGAATMEVPEDGSDGADGGAAADDEGTGRPARNRRGRTQRTYPAAPFEEAMELALAVQQHGAGQRIRRLRLFDLLERSPDSGTSRQMVTNSARYGLTRGNYSSEWIELTPQGHAATSDDVPERERVRTRFTLSIEQIPAFKNLYDRLTNSRLPAKSIIADLLREEGMSVEDASECVDIFLLNAKFVGVLQSLAGAERILPLDHVLDGLATAPPRVPGGPLAAPRAPRRTPAEEEVGVQAVGPAAGGSWDRICFYVTPIGEEGSEQRQHADLFLGSIIEPALEEFDLNVVRADRIAEAGMISRQIIEHIMHARLVIADLSFHNPNVFYELALRHMTGKPTIQVIRASERLPFDVEPVRTIRIDTSSIYTLVPQLEVHRSAITSQVRRALENPEAVDSPVTPFLQPRTSR